MAGESGIQGETPWERLVNLLYRVGILFILVPILLVLALLGAVGGFWPALVILLLGVFVAFPLWLNKEAGDLLAKVLTTDKSVFWKATKLMQLTFWTIVAIYTYSGDWFFDSERWRKIVDEIDDAEKIKPDKMEIK